jgi:hypothetical protein
MLVKEEGAACGMSVSRRSAEEGTALLPSRVLYRLSARLKREPAG